MLGPMEHFYSPALMDEGCRVKLKQGRQRMGGGEGGPCWGFPWQRCSSSSCLLQNFLHLPQLSCNTKGHSRKEKMICQHQAPQVSL